MKKFFEKTLMVMLAAFISLSITSCSNDDEPGKDGNMTGWVEINGQKYDYSYFYGGKSSDGCSFSFTGFNKDPYKLGNTNYNMMGMTLRLTPDGSQLDTEYGHLAINIEFNLDCNNGNDDADMVMYCNYDMSDAGITAKRSGEKLTIDGKDVEVRYSEPGTCSVGSTDPKTTVSFHFEGTPSWVDLPEED